MIPPPEGKRFWKAPDFTAYVRPATGHRNKWVIVTTSYKGRSETTKYELSCEERGSWLPLVSFRGPVARNLAFSHKGERVSLLNPDSPGLHVTDPALKLDAPARHD